MTVTVSPITPDFVAEIGDVDLSRPLSDSDVAAIKQAFWDHAVLIFAAQHLDRDQHLRFAEYIGPLERSIVLTDTPKRVDADLADVSNLNHANGIWGADSRLRQFQLGNRIWHTDSSFKYLPARASLLYARAIPPLGGHTEFADQRAAYDALSDEQKRRLEGLIAEHAIVHSRARLGFSAFSDEERRNMPPVPQMMVRTLPENGRKTLYVASHAGRVFSLPDDQGKALIDELLAHASQRQFVYTHRWRVNDLVMWDDRCTLHRGTPFDDLRYRREMERATVSDIANTCEQAGIDTTALRAEVA